MLFILKIKCKCNHIYYTYYLYGISHKKSLHYAQQAVELLSQSSQDLDNREVDKGEKESKIMLIII